MKINEKIIIIQLLIPSNRCGNIYKKYGILYNK